MDHFDRIHDSILLLIFNRIGDFKSLCRCCAVSRRFNNVATQVDNVVINVNDGMLESAIRYNQSSVLGLIYMMMSGIRANFRILYFCSRQFRYRSSLPDQGVRSVPVLNKFKEIKVLKIKLPKWYLGSFDSGALFKWKAEFGPGFRKCVVIVASSPIYRNKRNGMPPAMRVNQNDEAALRREFLDTVAFGFAFLDYDLRKYMRKVIAENSKLDNFVLTDADGVGVLSMTGLQELTLPSDLMVMSREKLNMRYRCDDILRLFNGVEGKGVTLGAVWPKEQSDTCDLANTFDEPYEACLRKLIPTRSDGLLYTMPFC